MSVCETKAMEQQQSKEEAGREKSPRKDQNNDFSASFVGIAGHKKC